MPFTQYDLAPLEGASLWGYIEMARTLRLATVQGDEPIELCPLWFVVHREAVYFAIEPTVGDPGRATTPGFRHVAALDAGCRVTALVDDGEDLTTFRGAQLSGRARLVEQKRLRETLLDLALEKYFYVGHPHLEHFLSRGACEARRWYQLDAERVAGWDRRLLPQPPIMERRILPPHLRQGRRKD
jgi:hypothetical protein